MKTRGPTVAATVRSILNSVRVSRRSALLMLSGATLIDVGVSGQAMATTLGGLTGRTSAAITATPIPTQSSGNSGAAAAPGQTPASTSQSTRDFSTALAAIQAQLAAQAAARTAAQAAPSSVPDGLAHGGLQVAPGLLWQGANTPSQSQANGQTTVEIDQTASQAILNWSTFNVGKNTTVYYNQAPGTKSDGTNTWVALNRVSDPSGVPSQILGQIKAEGSVYVVNHNGVIFGGTSQVNVHALVASSLDITDTQFLAGTIHHTVSNASTTPYDPPFANASGQAADVVVQAGAIIKTNAPTSVTTGGGGIFLLGGNVDNAGSLIAPDGQVLLAAGTSVYLYNSQDSSIHGAVANVLNGGTVTNEAAGYISAPTGNITLAGFDLRQKGVLAASTNVNEAGSIVLSAGDGLRIEASSQDYSTYYYNAHAMRAGTVELSAGSLTTVLPQEDGLTAVDGQPQGRSLVRLEGETVNVLGGAMVLAPGGKVQLNASSDPLNYFTVDYPTPGLYPQEAADTGRVYVGPGASIDVAGMQLVPVNASADAVQVNVRGNELRDDLAQQGGILTGANVWVDIHNLLTVAPDQIYTSGGLLEVSGWLGLTPRSIDERLTTGGSVNIMSTGDVILRPGSSIDIAGGSVLHQAGYVNHTFLVGADGKLYDVNSAPAEMQYVSIGMSTDVTDPRWNVTSSYNNGLLNGKVYESGYLQGKSAGSLSILSREVEFDSNVDASTVTGPYQRASGNLPKNGTLTLGGIAAGVWLEPNNVTVATAPPAPADVFASGTVTGLFPEDPNYYQGPKRARDPATLLPFDSQQTTYLPQTTVNNAKYGAIVVNALAGPIDQATQAALPGGFNVAGGASLVLAPGGSLTVTTTGGALIDGSIVARGGSVTLTTGGGGAGMPPPPSIDIELKPGALIDTRGLWTNDAANPGESTPLLYNGGNVTLHSGGNVLLDAGSVIDASSGGWVKENGAFATSAGLPVGTGGNISLNPDYGIGLGPYGWFYDQNYNRYLVNAPQTYPYQVILNGAVRSYGFTRGGTLSVSDPQITIGGTGTSGQGVLALAPGFFTAGFGGYQLYGFQGVTVAPGTDIELHGTGFTPSPELISVPTGSDFTAFTKVGATSSLAPPQPVNLILSATDPFAGDLTVGRGAVIKTDPGATVGLHGQHALFFDGTVDDPAGRIYLDLYGASSPTGSVISYTVYSNPGYDPRQVLWIGADARLSAPGYVASYGDPATGTVTNVVRDGGSVSINTDALDALYYPDKSIEQLNAVPLGAVVAESGAQVNIAGASGNILVQPTGTLRGYTPTPIASNGGSLTIDASLGLFWNASIDAHAGGAAAAGGSLTIDQHGFPAQPGGVVPYSQPVFELVVSQHAADVASGLIYGTAVPASLSGQLAFSADQIAAGGFGKVSLGADDAVVFNGDVHLSVADTLQINALNLSATPGANVTLSAPYVDIGGGQRINHLGYNNASINAAATPGTANLTVNAGLIDVEGSLNSGASYTYTSAYLPDYTTTSTDVSLPGFAAINFNSTGDIRFFTQQQPSLHGVLSTQGDLNFDAAQVYATTGSGLASAFTLRATGPSSTITFARTSTQTPAVPLSAGAILNIIAPTIVQGGVLRAPMGQIVFGDPNNPTYSSVTLLPGSITSVSADGALIPWGQPLGTTSWNYGYTLNGTAPAGVSAQAPPAKLVGFYGSSVDVRSGAVIDESGGGDLYGAQFVPGRSGSVDVLSGSQTFAIVPSFGNAPAPRDPQMQRADGGAWTDSTPVALGVGSEVYLSGVKGLAAGYYTLLPGHYALLPGAFRVTVSEADVMPSGIVPNQELRSGNFLVSGYLANANTGQRAPLPSEFLVTPGSIVRKESQYDESTIGQFFAAQAAAAGLASPPLPADAGRLVIEAIGSLNFQGTDDFSTAKGGRGGQADIVGTNLFISGSSGDVAPAGYISLGAASLNNIGAQSLLVGGTRRLASNTIDIAPAAQFVEIAGDAELKAPEVMVAATSAVTLDPGAVIDTTGFAALPNSFPTNPLTGATLGAISLSGASGAFLMASNATPLPVTRSSPSASTGTLTLGANSAVYAGNNVVVNDTYSTVLDPTTRFVAPTVDVAADVINLGGGTTGFTLSPAFLNTISQGDPSRGLGPTTTLILSASSSIDAYGGATLGTYDPAAGTYSLQNLVLSAPLIQGAGAPGDTARIAANQITLQGAATAGTATQAGRGALELDTSKLTLDAGAMNLAGFQSTTVNVSGRVVGKGAGVFNVAGDLTVATPVITGAAKADTTLSATGALQLTRPAGVAGGTEATAASGLGAHFSASGATVTANTDLEFVSGAVNLTGGNVAIGAGGVVDVSGALVPIFDVVRITPAGTINLTALSGDVAVASGATLDVRGGDLTNLDRTKTPRVDALSSDKGSDAGGLNIVATAGTATLDGQIKVGAVAGYNGGKASLNLGTGDATTLLAALTGFTGEQDLALATGDINISSVKAGKVNLSAASGNLTVTGLIDASGPNRGAIELTAGHNLTLASGAKLDAHSTATDGQGGDVTLGLDGLSTGVLTLASGSSIDVSGAKTGGTLWLRAPQVGASGVAIAPTGVTVTGARNLTVEAIAVTDVTANPYVDQALVAADSQAASYMANAAAIRTSLGGIASDPAFHLLPGIELRSSGDLTLLTNPTATNDGIDLHTYRYNGEPMALTLRAAGNLNINGSLSDGFASPVTVGNDPVTGNSSGTVYAIAQQLPSGSPSATLRLVAGANLAAADPTALTPLSQLAAGEGSINLNAPQYDQASYPIPSVVRTGTGDLTLAAGRDINFQSQFGVYTAGTPSGPVAGFTDPTRALLSDAVNGPSYLGYQELTSPYDPNPVYAPSYDTVYPTALYANYPTAGGDLKVIVQGNLTSATITQPNGTTAYAASEPDPFWLWTQWTGTTPQDQATWFINFGTYYQAYHGGSAYSAALGEPAVAAFVGLGALGGGDATVTVGGNMLHVDVAVPTSGRIPTGTPDLARAVIEGGGNVNLSVAGSLDGGNVIAADGLASVRAADIGSIASVDFVPGNDAQFNVYADRNLRMMIGDMTRMGDQYDPTGASLGTMLLGLEGIMPFFFAPQPIAPYGFFTSYTAATAMDLRAGGGDVTLSGDYTPAVMNVTADTGSILQGATLPYAGSDTNVQFGQRLLYALPEPNSQIDLLAGTDVQLGISTNGLEPTIGEPKSQLLYTYAGTVGNFNTSAISLLGPPSDLVQPNDPRTDHVYALNGSIVGVSLSTSKQTNIHAGQDINEPAFFLQNNNEGDVSVIQAGRDITSCPEAPSSCGAGYDFNMQIGGPGNLVVEAGRNLLLQSDLTPQYHPYQLGISSVGNTYNASLPSDGASLAIEVGVGAGPQNVAFINAYIDPASAGTVAASYTADLINYMRKRTGTTLSVADAVAAFRALTPEQQAPLIQQVYFAEIKAGGRTAAAGLGAGGHGYDRAYNAMQTLFPGTKIGQPTTAYSGNLTIYGYGAIRTESGGDVGIIVPGGDITLGFENQTPDLTGRSDTAKPGVLTLRGGDVNMVSDGSQVVAQSRVFTELGGNIMMWSTNGDVNAGKGKKTSIVTSPPQFTYDGYGNVTKSPVTPQTGAGIATLIGVPGVQPGDVDLFAPHGTVDAGDAGIRVSGNIYVAAEQVANADNIQVQGKSFGLPPQPVTNLALATASNASTEAAAIVKPTVAQEARTSVNVEVTGFGGDDNSCASSTTRSSQCPQ